MHNDVATDGRCDTLSEARSHFIRLVVPCRLPARLDVFRSRHHGNSDNKSVHKFSDVAPTGSALPEFAPLFLTIFFLRLTVLVSAPEHSTPCTFETKRDLAMNGANPHQ